MTRNPTDSPSDTPAPELTPRQEQAPRAPANPDAEQNQVTAQPGTEPVPAANQPPRPPADPPNPPGNHGNNPAKNLMDVDDEIEIIRQKIVEFDRKLVEERKVQPKPLREESWFWPTSVLVILGILLVGLAFFGRFLTDDQRAWVMILGLLLILSALPVMVIYMALDSRRMWQQRRADSLNTAHTYARHMAPLARDLRLNHSRAAILGAADDLDLSDGVIERRLSSVLGKSVGGVIPVLAVFIPPTALLVNLLKDNKELFSPLVTDGIMFGLLTLLGAAIGGVLARHSTYVVPEYRAFLKRVANVMETQEKEAKEQREREKEERERRERE